MSYHVNEKTGNPNVCRTASCDLDHFDTKAEATASKEKVSDNPPVEVVAEKVNDGVKAVKKELKKDKKVAKEKKEKAPESTEGKVKAVKTEAKEEAQDVIGDFKEATVKVKKKAKDVAHNAPNPKELASSLVAAFNDLAKAAPDHKLVRKGKKVFKKYAK